LNFECDWVECLAFIPLAKVTLDAQIVCVLLGFKRRQMGVRNRSVTLPIQFRKLINIQYGEEAQAISLAIFFIKMTEALSVSR